MADALRENADGERRCWTGCSESLLLLILAFIALTLFRACRIVCSRTLHGKYLQFRRISNTVSEIRDERPP